MAEIEYPALLITTESEFASAVKQEIEAFPYKQYDAATPGNAGTSPSELPQKQKQVAFLISHGHPEELGDKLKAEFANSGVGIETRIVNSENDFHI